MLNDNKIYIMGHRNPDTDSICSAISYTYLKKALGFDNVVAARCGEINKETTYALNYFGVEKPLLVKDIYPRVKNAAKEATFKVLSTDTIYTLRNIMLKENVRSVPVVDENNAVLGMVSVSDLAKAYLKEISVDEENEYTIDVSELVNILDATKISFCNKSKIMKSSIKIADGCMKRFSDSLSSSDVVILGDRSEKAFHKTMDKKVAMIIVSSSNEVPEEIIERAKSEEINILVTKYNPVEILHLLGQCVPVSNIMTTDIISFEADDMLSDIKEIMQKNEYRNYPVVENNKLVGILNKDQFVMPKPQEVILTDHNELGQAVEGIESGKILEVIDHHRFGGLKTSDPIFINVRPVGCTCTIVTNMYREHNITPPREIAGLLMSAIISDTVLFKSPTCTEIDKEAVKYLAEITGVNYEEYGLNMLKAGADVSDMTAKEIVKNDSKEFTIGSHKMLISQLSVLDTDTIMAKKEDIVKEMENLCKENGYDMDIVIITDIIKEGSYLVFVGEPKNLIGEAFAKDASEGIIYLDGVMSRKKQIIPPLSEAVKRI